MDHRLSIKVGANVITFLHFFSPRMEKLLALYNATLTAYTRVGSSIGWVSIHESALFANHSYVTTVGQVLLFLHLEKGSVIPWLIWI